MPHPRGEQQRAMLGSPPAARERDRGGTRYDSPPAQPEATPPSAGRASGPESREPEAAQDPGRGASPPRQPPPRERAKTHRDNTGHCGPGTTSRPHCKRASRGKQREHHPRQRGPRRGTPPASDMSKSPRPQTPGSRVQPPTRRATPPPDPPQARQGGHQPNAPRRPGAPGAEHEANETPPPPPPCMPL
ncbi:basic salivary proline-rich protein 1-like [Scophthalmus maximus]|uniref:basic salivary proline-rich protein 1-like n=1 Tax=Scophthalmus maximus TaxID=52904 RepID=UPI0015E12CD2|nr:basic salivary proline-rich protein 1-like [Scophthalmus maximus]